MKTALFIIGILLVTAGSVNAQNFMGMSRNKVMKSIGEPDRVENNSYVYSDLYEKGDNIYYFDENGFCKSFEIVRSNYYLKTYMKMLKNEFVEGNNNTYFIRMKNKYYQADLILLQNSFQIKIQDVCEMQVSNQFPSIAQMLK